MEAELHFSRTVESFPPASRFKLATSEVSCYRRISCLESIRDFLICDTPLSYALKAITPQALSQEKLFLQLDTNFTIAKYVGIKSLEDISRRLPRQLRQGALRFGLFQSTQFDRQPLGLRR